LIIFSRYLIPCGERLRFLNSCLQYFKAYGLRFINYYVVPQYLKAYGLRFINCYVVLQYFKAYGLWFINCYVVLQYFKAYGLWFINYYVVLQYFKAYGLWLCNYYVELQYVIPFGERLGLSACYLQHFKAYGLMSFQFHSVSLPHHSRTRATAPAVSHVPQNSQGCQGALSHSYSRGQRQTQA